jgi:hypothetical protein
VWRALLPAVLRLSLHCFVPVASAAALCLARYRFCPSPAPGFTLPTYNNNLSPADDAQSASSSLALLASTGTASAEANYRLAQEDGATDQHLVRVGLLVVAAEGGKAEDRVQLQLSVLPMPRGPARRATAWPGQAMEVPPTQSSGARTASRYSRRSSTGARGLAARMATCVDKGMAMPVGKGASVLHAACRLALATWVISTTHHRRAHPELCELHIQHCI